MIGIQAALRARDTAGLSTAGHGQHVKVTLLGSLLSGLANQASSTLETGTSPTRLGNAHPSISPYETLQTQDQPIAVAVGTDAQFQRLCEVLGAPDIARDARFVDNPSRVAHRAALRSLLEERLAARSAAEWTAAFTEVNVPAGRVNSIGQAIDLAESLGLGMVAHTTARRANGDDATIRTIASPISFSRTPAQYLSPPPNLGEHNDTTWRDTTGGSDA